MSFEDKYSLWPYCQSWGSIRRASQDCSHTLNIFQIK